MFTRVIDGSLYTLSVRHWERRPDEDRDMSRTPCRAGGHHQIHLAVDIGREFCGEVTHGAIEKTLSLAQIRLE
jgi:hypothetical protein